MSTIVKTGIDVKSVLVEVGFIASAIGVFYLLKGEVDAGAGFLSYSVIGYYAVLMALIGLLINYSQSFISNFTQSAFAIYAVGASMLGMIAFPLWALWVAGVLFANFTPNVDALAVILSGPVYLGIPYLLAVGSRRA